MDGRERKHRHHKWDIPVTNPDITPPQVPDVSHQCSRDASWVVVLYRHQDRQSRKEKVRDQDTLRLLLQKAFVGIAILEDVVEEIAADKDEEVSAAKDDIRDELLDWRIYYPAGAADRMAGDDAHNCDGAEGFEAR